MSETFPNENLRSGRIGQCPRAAHRSYKCQLWARRSFRDSMLQLYLQGYIHAGMSMQRAITRTCRRWNRKLRKLGRQMRKARRGWA